MRFASCLLVLAASALWADEAADRAAIEAAISALNAPQTPSDLFTADFPNAAELRSLREQQTVTVSLPVPADGLHIQTSAGTLVISRGPMGEATFYPPPNFSGSLKSAPRFNTRSITFVTPNSAVVVGVCESESFPRQGVPVLFVLKSDGTKWRIASLRVLTEAQTPVL